MSDHQATVVRTRGVVVTFAAGGDFEHLRAHLAADPLSVVGWWVTVPAWDDKDPPGSRVIIASGGALRQVGV